MILTVVNEVHIIAKHKKEKSINNERETELVVFTPSQ